MGTLSVLDFASTVEAAVDRLGVAGDISQASFDFENVEPESQSQNSPRPYIGIQEHRGRLMVVTGSHGKHTSAILSIAHRQAIASGATNTAEVAAEAFSRGISETQKMGLNRSATFGPQEICQCTS
jgi:hypothetical protein